MSDDLLSKIKSIEYQIQEQKQELLREHTLLFKKIKQNEEDNTLDHDKKREIKKKLIERLEMIMLEINGLEQMSKVSSPKTIETLVNTQDTGNKEDWIEAIFEAKEKDYSC